MTVNRQTEVLEPLRKRTTSPTKSSDRGETPQESPAEHRLADLLEAFELLSHRGVGVRAWAAPFRDDPLAFLLDTVSDGARIWNARGDLVYENRAAAEIGVGGSNETPVEVLVVNDRSFERRCLRCHFHDVDYILEIVREVAPH
jgi:hypothetical protein